MNDRKTSIDRLLLSLQERAKELECFYAVQDILAAPDQPIETICRRLIEVIPLGWQSPLLCRVRISIGTSHYTSAGFEETPWTLSADIVVQERVVGYIRVCYTQNAGNDPGGPFLVEESQLLQAIADRLGSYLSQRLDRKIIEGWSAALANIPSHERCDWQIALDTIKRANRELYQSISRKMLNYLCWCGVPEAEPILRSFHPARLSFESADYEGEWNTPHEGHGIGFTTFLGTRVFAAAAEHLDPDQIMRLIQTWVQEDKQSFLIRLVGTNVNTASVADMVRRYYEMSRDPSFIPIARTRGILISLIRRFLSEDRSYVDIARELMDISDFHGLLQRSIYSAESHGRLGGKAAGLYLATQIMRKKEQDNPALQGIKTPKTWYITSDVLFHFVHHCNFDDVVDQKYKPIQQVRLEYPCIVQAFKSVPFPADITRSLAVALDDFGDNPIIVRSSSLLEDRIGAAFSGKYKSLFLANQGSKRRRLEALTDAIAEVYASTFGPDPVEYRADRGLLDYNEEMGILIQEVVGKRMGRYFLPAFAGVAFSSNDFRWSSRVKREDGLLRMVPGLGTRAVDRLSDDYPVLISPGQPNLRVNVTPDEICRYSPRFIDVINLESESFESIRIDAFLAESGDAFPELDKVFSIYREDQIGDVRMTGIEFSSEQPVATFNGLVTRTPFIKQIQSLLAALHATLGCPVDIEFASDGISLYLLQCRPQSHTIQCTAASIPTDIPRERIVFNARRFVCDGLVQDVTHIVYVDPDGYAGLADLNRMIEVGYAVSKLNEILPRRRFILMGPGRWGSRGDIKLGVSVDYAGINNTAMLIEIARKKGSYVPELSFGTHFFQDLVESNIRYLPLYPDDAGIIFNEELLHGSPNLLTELAPEYAYLSDVIRVIDLPKSAHGQLLCVAMNATVGEALAYLTPPHTRSM
ncbi:MAG: PEP/pyruvate-binding domain-containing protein [Candidatus Zixiibacteriota bacterium]